MYCSGETKVLPPRGREKKGREAVREPCREIPRPETRRFWPGTFVERASRTTNLVLLCALDVMAQGIHPAHTNWNHYASAPPQAAALGSMPSVVNPLFPLPLPCADRD
ncbi:hypothetical protein CGRA01v4_06701 [Colletotrichum graminicola]|nr:hypothetical protein CGRA01v4_06701 [Colletotrichum graminicola]